MNNMDFAYYGYNAANTRAYKLSMLNTSQWVNGVPQSIQLNPQQSMFYPNAYINFNQNGEYTKHYYNGTERIASRLGDNQQTIEADANDRLLSRIAQTDEIFKAQIGEMAAYEEPAVNVPARGNGEGTRNLLFPSVGYDPIPAFTDLQPTGNTTDIFYYHTNHLGSTAFVTDQNQTVTQGFLYAPFGEITTEYAPLWQNGTLPKYAFNAKELDEETGMYYYEARYYKPPVFTSRDPMFEKYFWMTPYAYCANNPVKYVDPDGKDAIYITFPKYKADGYPATGHAGVLLIDNTTGLTKYYEYGRYDKENKGIVRTYQVPNVEMKDGLPTAESLNAVLNTISKKSGKGQVLKGAYIKSDDFNIMNDYAKLKLKENTDKNRVPYNIFTNNCGTFADDVIKQDQTFFLPIIIDPRPVSIIKEYQGIYTSIFYDPKKGTTIELSEKTIIYNNQTKTTEVKQTLWQKIRYDIN